MKKIAFISTFFFLISGTLYAAEVTLGITTWYLRWEPRFENEFRGEGNGITASDPINNSPEYNDHFTYPRDFMIGPLASIRLNETWSIGLVLLIARGVEAEGSYNVDNIPSGTTYLAKYDMSYDRYDSDLTFTCRIGSGFGIFFGVKYLRWHGTGEGNVISSTDVQVYHVDIDNTGQSFGPAVGVNFAAPLIGMLFFTSSLSGIVMKVWDEDDNKIVSILSGESRENNITSYFYSGFNVTAGLGYYITPLRTTVTLGGRFQYLKSEDTPRDLFYGITAAVTYTL